VGGVSVGRSPIWSMAFSVPSSGRPSQRVA
jgi:hypothetical protein